jgi:hypothetical protein
VVESKILHFTLALLLALIAAGLAALAYLNRDFVFEWQRVEAVGKFSTQPEPALSGAALSFAQEKMARPGETCVGEWLGKDDRYLYMTVGCAHFEEKAGKIETSGDANFHPTRFRYSGGEVSKWEQPNEAEFDNSMRRLFPREAMQLLPGHLNPEVFRRQGFARQQQAR